MNLAFVNEGWEDGPTKKRELKEPGRIKKDSILFTAFGMLYFVFFIFWELSAAFGIFLWRLIVRPEPKSLRGKVCLVTGSGRGLGRQLCIALAKEGAVIACADINEPNNMKTVAMLKVLGAKAVAYTVNVAIKKDVEDLVSKIEKELGSVYLLINNAALVSLNPKIDEEFIRASFNVNVFGPVWLMNAVLPSMLLRNEGHIVNIVSLGTKLVVPALNVYGATKTALSYMSGSLRADLLLSKKENIRVTEVHPTIMNTSEDYLSFVDFKVNVVVEMEEVVKATMDAIHYNYDEVIVPSFVKYPLLVINEMMPSRTAIKLMQLTTGKWSIPNEEQRKNLPWHDIVKECSFVGTANGLIKH